MPDRETLPPVRAAKASGPKRRLLRLGEGEMSPQRAGAKAASLHELARGGFRVPEGFVVAHDLELGDLDPDALRETVASIGGFPVAVRSSGVLEDLDGASFAGQYETYLDVAGVEELVSALGACRCSGESERVQSYLSARGMSEEQARVSVLVQRMVRAEVAGVAFTLDPISGREEHARVELVRGLGERLVSGRATPTSAILSLADGAVVEEGIGSDGARLEPGLAEALRRCLLAVQAHRGRPQDVEWAMDGDGQLFVLQARPITRVQWRTDVEEYTNADFRDGGVSARVCTPLMYALYRSAMQESLQAYFEDVRLIERGRRETWIACYYGRPYWNASAVKRALAQVPGFDEAAFDRDLGLQKDYGAKGPVRVGNTPRAVLGALPVAWALRGEYRSQLSRVAAFREPFLARERRWRRRIEAFSGTPDEVFFRDLEGIFRVHRDTERAYFRTIYSNSTAQGELHAIVAKIDAATGHATVLTRLLGGLTGVHHMAMQQGVVELVRIAREEGTEGSAWDGALAAFLRDHGFHADVELDLTVPRWESVPHRVRAMIESLAAAGGEPADPRAAGERQRASYEEELRSVRAALRSHRVARLRYARSFETRLARARAFLSAREEMREYSTRCYALVRLYVVEAGRRLAARGALDAPDDVFLLTPDEIGTLGRQARAPDALAGDLERRRLYYRGYRDFPAPGELGGGLSEGAAETPAKTDDERVLVGLGCSNGVVTGPVRVVTSVDQCNLLRSGEVLVTRFTDPGWTPALGLVAAVVTEVGGLLSHAAVIGREYGIPAVLNLPGATARLETGVRVRVDGGRGTVEILDEKEAS